MVLWLSPVHRHNYYPTHQQTIRHKYIVQVQQICTKRAYSISIKVLYNTKHTTHHPLPNLIMFKVQVLYCVGNILLCARHYLLAILSHLPTEAGLA